MTSVTPDFPDWTTPVGLLDQAAFLPVGGQALVANGAGVTLDTSDVASVTIMLKALVSSAADMFILTAQWREDGQIVANETLTLWGSAGPTFEYVHQWQLPARGGQLVLLLSGTSNTAATYAVMGSTRTVQDGRYSYPNSPNTRLLLDTGSVAVGAGASSAGFAIPAVTSRVALRMNFTLTAIQLQLNAIASVGGAPALVPFEYFSTPAGIAGSFIAEAPFMATQLVMVNTDTGGHAIHTYAWDVS